MVGFLPRFTGLFGTGDDLRIALSIGLVLAFACQAIALALGLVVVWQIEGLQRSKHAAIADK